MELAEADAVKLLLNEAFAFSTQQSQVVEAGAGGGCSSQVGLDVEVALRPGQADAERLIKVREAVGDGPLVYGDWNCGATTLDAIRAGRGAAHLDVMLDLVEGDVGQVSADYAHDSAGC